MHQKLDGRSGEDVFARKFSFFAAMNVGDSVAFYFFSVCRHFPPPQPIVWSISYCIRACCYLRKKLIPDKLVARQCVTLLIALLKHLKYNFNSDNNINLFTLQLFDI